MSLGTVSRILGYSVAVLGVATGALMLSGVLHVAGPRPMRITFGVVLIAYGVYRFVLTRMPARAADDEPRGRRASRWEGRWGHDEDEDEEEP